MQFNRYVFDCYLATEAGQKALAFFTQLPKLVEQRQAQTLRDFLAVRLPSTQPLEYWQEQIELAADWTLAETEENSPARDASVEASANIDEAIDGYLDFIDELIDEGEWPPRDLLTFIPGLSLFVQHLDRDFFLPYFLVDHFFQLETICSEFSIPLPPPPGKRQYRERLYYYAEICRSLHEFRISHGLSPEEMAAFLYDFAPRVAPGFFAEGELPDPINVQLVITFKEQAEKIQNKQAPILIQGNERTQPGDIILTYSISPKKSIISIARAVSKGFFDPFSYYPQQIWIGSPRPIPPLHLKQMRENEILGGKSIIKKNMQATAGVSFTPTEYNAILSMLEARDFDTTSLPRLVSLDLPQAAQLDNERDVETELLEPLLQRLGFTEEDWLRQMSLRMGRGERVYPDYALLAQTKRGEESARFIWEAKYRIANEASLREAFFQAKSYALRLASAGFALVAVEGVWVSLAREQFAFDKLLHFSWATLAQTEGFSSLAKLCAKSRLETAK